MLVLADRGFFSYSLWSGAQAAGAELLWRTKRNHVLPVEERLADGSFLSTIYPTQTDRRHGTGGVVMRVVEYVLGQPAGADDDEMTYRLLTTVLDPDKAPAAELAALHAQRREFETALDELKSHSAVRGWFFAPRCPTVSARRPTHTCACTTPSAGSCTPSPTMPAPTPTGSAFTRTLRVAPGTTSHPGVSPEVLDDAQRRATAELLPERRHRANPRLVKRKMSNFGVKRPEHRNWPSPTRAVHVLHERQPRNDPPHRPTPTSVAHSGPSPE